MIIDAEMIQMMASTLCPVAVDEASLASMPSRKSDRAVSSLTASIPWSVSRPSITSRWCRTGKPRDLAGKGCKSAGERANTVEGTD